MPRTLPQALPAEDSAAGEAARDIGRLIGPALQAPSGTATEAELLGLGDGVAAHDATVASLRAQAFASTADVLLDQWEDSLGLARIPALTTEARRNRVLSKLRASRGNTPSAVLAALAPYDQTVELLVPLMVDIVASEPNAALLTEPNFQRIPATQRKVYRLAAVIKREVFADLSRRAQINAALAQMAPAHCSWTAAVRSDFAGTAPGRYYDDSAFDGEVYGYEVTLLVNDRGEPLVGDGNLLTP